MHSLMMALGSERISLGFYVKNTSEVIKYMYLHLYNAVVEFAIFSFLKQ